MNNADKTRVAELVRMLYSQAEALAYWSDAEQWRNVEERAAYMENHLAELKAIAAMAAATANR
jgi:hypothetical protein